MIPKAQLPFLIPLSDQVKRKKMVDSKRKFTTKKSYRAPRLTSKTSLKAQIKRFTG